MRETLKFSGVIFYHTYRIVPYIIEDKVTLLIGHLHPVGVDGVYRLMGLVGGVGDIIMRGMPSRINTC